MPLFMMESCNLSSAFEITWLNYFFKQNLSKWSIEPFKMITHDNGPCNTNNMSDLLSHAIETPQ